MDAWFGALPPSRHKLRTIASYFEPRQSRAPLRDARGSQYCSARGPRPRRRRHRRGGTCWSSCCSSARPYHAVLPSPSYERSGCLFRRRLRGAPSDDSSCVSLRAGFKGPAHGVWRPGCALFPVLEGARVLRICIMHWHLAAQRRWVGRARRSCHRGPRVGLLTAGAQLLNACTTRRKRG